MRLAESLSFESDTFRASVMLLFVDGALGAVLADGR